MKSNFVVALVASALVSTSAFAQAVALPQPPLVQQPASAAYDAAPLEGVLPANTEVIVTMNDDVSSKSHKLGDKFSLTVDQDVKVDGNVVIPRGTRAVGQITARSGRGGFGKSGKMNVEFRYIDLNGRRIPIEGRHRQAGEGRTAATVGAVFAAGVIGGVIVKGKNASIGEGREFTVRTVDAVPVTLSADKSAPALIAASYEPSEVNMEVLTKKEQKAAAKAKLKAKKKSRA